MKPSKYNGEDGYTYTYYHEIDHGDGHTYTSDLINKNNVVIDSSYIRTYNNTSIGAQITKNGIFLNDVVPLKDLDCTVWFWFDGTDTSRITKYLKWGLFYHKTSTHSTEETDFTATDGQSVPTTSNSKYTIQGLDIANSNFKHGYNSVRFVITSSPSSASNRTFKVWVNGTYIGSKQLNIKENATSSGVVPHFRRGGLHRLGLRTTDDYVASSNKEFIYHKMQVHYKTVDTTLYPSRKVNNTTSNSGIVSLGMDGNYTFIGYVWDEYMNTVNNSEILLNITNRDLLTVTEKSNFQNGTGFKTIDDKVYYSVTPQNHTQYQVNVIPKNRSYKCPVFFEVQAHLLGDYIYNKSANAPTTAYKQSFRGVLDVYLKDKTNEEIKLTDGSTTIDLNFEQSGADWNEPTIIKVKGLPENDPEANSIIYKGYSLKIYQTSNVNGDTLIGQYNADANGEVLFRVPAENPENATYKNLTFKVRFDGNNSYDSFERTFNVHLTKFSVTINPTLTVNSSTPHIANPNWSEEVEYPTSLTISWNFDDGDNFYQSPNFPVRLRRYHVTEDGIKKDKEYSELGTFSNGSHTDTPTPPSTESDRFVYQLDIIGNNYFNGTSVTTSSIHYVKGSSQIIFDLANSKLRTYVKSKITLLGHLICGGQPCTDDYPSLSYSISFPDDPDFSMGLSSVNGTFNPVDGSFSINHKYNQQFEGKIIVRYEGSRVYKPTSEEITVHWFPKNLTKLSINVVDKNNNDATKTVFNKNEPIRVKGLLTDKNNQALDGTVTLKVWWENNETLIRSQTVTNGVFLYDIRVEDMNDLGTKSSNLRNKPKIDGSPGDDFYKFQLVYDETEEQDACTTEFVNVYYRNPTHFENLNASNMVNMTSLGGKGFSWYALDNGTFTLKLKDYIGESLGNKNVEGTPNLHKYNPTNFKYDITLPSDYIPHTFKTDNSNTSNKGNLVYSFTSPKAINGSLTFKYDGDDELEPCTLIVPFEYKIIPLHVSTTLGYTTEVTLEGQATLTLKDGRYSKDTAPVMKGIKVSRSITFTWDTQHDNLSGTINEEYKEASVATSDNNGQVTIKYTPQNQGGIIGTCQFQLVDNDIYRPNTPPNYNINVANIHWHRIKTQVTANNLTIYNGRYTNIAYEEPDWTIASPGTNSNYTNVYAKLNATETNTIYKTTQLSNLPLQVIDSFLEDWFPGLKTDNNGEIHKRWTKEVQGGTWNEDIKVKYGGNNLFLPCETTFHLTILQRVTPKTEMDFKSEHWDPVRYNIPMTITTTLFEENGRVLMKNQKVTVRFNNNNIGTGRTDNEGQYKIEHYRSQVVGNIPVNVLFNEDDLIDKYSPMDDPHTCVVDKDSPYLEYINLPTVITDNCNNKKFNVKVEMYNSIDEKITTHEKIEWYENIGDTYTGEQFEPCEIEPLETTINNNGYAEHQYYSFSPVKLIKTFFRTTWCYYSTTRTSYFQYDIKTVYGFQENLTTTPGHTIKGDYGTQTLYPVHEGKVDIDLGCKLAEGLYDVHIEYIGSIDNSCQRYSDSEIFKGIRKKIPTGMTPLTNSQYNNTTKRYEEEAGKQFHVPMKLENYERNEDLTDKKIITNVDNIDPLTQRTNNEAKVTRNWVNNTVNDEDLYTFKHEQTRKTAGCLGEAEGYTLPKTPIIAYVDPDGFEWFERTIDGEHHYCKRWINSSQLYYTAIGLTKEQFDEGITITHYAENTFPIKIRVYEEKELFSLHGEQIRQNMVGHHVYKTYDAEGNPYYYEKDQLETVPHNEEYYNQCERIITLEPVSGATVIYRSTDGTEVGRGTTELNTGLFTLDTYKRTTTGSGRLRVYVEHSDFNSTTNRRIELNTLPRITTTVSLVPLESDKHYNVIKTNNNYKFISNIQDPDNHEYVLSIYDNPYNIRCKLSNSLNAQGIPNKTIKFVQVQNSTDSRVVIPIGTATTDENGVASVEYVPQTGRDYKIQCIFDTDNKEDQIYKKTEKIFVIPTAKQTPKLTFKITPPSGAIQYGDEITLTASLVKTGTKYGEVGIYGKTVQFFTVSKGVYGISDIYGYDWSAIEDNKEVNGLLYKKRLGKAKIDADGVATLKCKLNAVGDRRIWAYFEGTRNNDAYPNLNLTGYTSLDAYYHSTSAIGGLNSDGTITIHPRDISITGGNIYSEAFMYAKNSSEGAIHKITIIDSKTKAPLSNKIVYIDVTPNFGTNRDVLNPTYYSARTDANGQVGVMFLKNRESFVRELSQVSSGVVYVPKNMIPVTIGVLANGNVGKQYKIVYYFNYQNTTRKKENGEIIENGEYTNTYTSETFSTFYNFYKAPTYLLPPRKNEAEDCETTLMIGGKRNGVSYPADSPMNNTPLGTKTVSFYNYDNSAWIASDDTDSTGKAVISKSSFQSASTYHVLAKFSGDTEFLPCSNGGYYTNSNIDDCNSLESFDLLKETWYASTQNCRIKNGRNNPSYIDINDPNHKKICLYKVCNDLKDNGFLDDGVHAPTGIVLRSNKICTTKDCTVTFKLKLVSKRKDGGWGGHFGLTPGGNIRVDDEAPARFEMYYYPIGGHNYYYIQCNDSQNVGGMKGDFKTTLKFNTWYSFSYRIENNGMKITCINNTTGESYAPTSKKYTKSYDGLYPYIMCYMNDCELVIRELRMEKNE